MTLKTFSILLFCIYLLYGCEKNPVPQQVTKDSAVYWSNIVFSQSLRYFSTIDTSFKSLTGWAGAQNKFDNVDLYFIYDLNYGLPGFIDPYTSSQHWAWDDYYAPWFSNAYHTKYFLTKLDKTNFDSAKVDETKIQFYFSDTSLVHLAPHDVFTPGTCVGGRPICLGPADCAIRNINLIRNHVYGFTSNNKKGFILILDNQSYGWPGPYTNLETKVDILKEK